jgi:hypothetical protein
MYISKEKKEKISEQILAHLYLNNPKPIFTFHIAKEIARDEEFVKKLLNELKKKELVLQITKNPQGIDYLKRSRWKLSEKAYIFYRQKQVSN